MIRGSPDFDPGRLRHLRLSGTFLPGHAAHRWPGRAEPDPDFAAGWHIDEPLAQGALRFASVTILDQLRDAGDEAASPRPDLGDLGPLGLFPSGVRSAMTLRLCAVKAPVTV